MDADQTTIESRVERRRTRATLSRRAARPPTHRHAIPWSSALPCVAVAVAGVVAVCAGAVRAVEGDAALTAGALLGGVAALVAAVLLGREIRAGRRLVAREQELRTRLDTVATLLTHARQIPDPVDEPDAAAKDELEAEAYDPVSGLMHQNHLAVVIQQRVAAARRRIQPVSVVVFEIDGLERAARGGFEPWRVVGRVVRTTLRESDVACRIGDTTLIAVLEDTPEQGGLTTADRFRQALRRSEIGGYLTVSSGIAGYPSHALEAPDLLLLAGQALDVARRTGVDFLAAPVD